VQTNPFSSSGVWLRGNTHSHSTLSDGRLPVAERFRAYREAGYDFLVLTDHGKVTDVAEHSTSEFLAISGSELHPPNPYGGDRYHIVAIHISREVPYQNRHPNEVIADVRAQGGLAVLCHPYWCGHSLRDLAPLQGWFAVEVYNDTCMRIGKGYSEAHWDDLLDEVGPCWGIAADDAHGVDEDVFHGWLMVKATERSIPAVLTALEQGAFYSTQGPEFLDLSVETRDVPRSDGTARPAPVVRVRCSPARSLVFKGQRSRGERLVAEPGSELTAAEYPVIRGEKYVRVEITDAAGKRAWSNPLFFPSAG